MSKAGIHMTDDSVPSERRLTTALGMVTQYVQKKLPPGVKLVHLKQMSLYDCQIAFHAAGGPEPTEGNRRVYMKPDGGVFAIEKDGVLLPILIPEDKTQGTNDRLKAEGKAKQALGNAIERAAKNIRGAEMLCSGIPYFPYVIFAAGCDFHHSETISKRLEMMNMGVPNHYMEVTPEHRDDVSTILDRINIDKRYNNSAIATICTKAHKWDEMTHGSSSWSVDEYSAVCRRVVDLSLERLEIGME